MTEPIGITGSLATIAELRSVAREFGGRDVSEESAIISIVETPIGRLYVHMADIRSTYSSAEIETISAAIGIMPSWMIVIERSRGPGGLELSRQLASRYMRKFPCLLDDFSGRWWRRLDLGSDCIEVSRP